MNVLKPHLQITIATLLARGESQHEIARRTGVDRKTIRRYALTANSPMATGSPEAAVFKIVGTDSITRPEPVLAWPCSPG